MDFSQACVAQLRENVDSEHIRNTKSSVILQQFFLHVKCYKHAKRNLFYQIVIWVLAEHLLMLTKMKFIRNEGSTSTKMQYMQHTI